MSTPDLPARRIGRFAGTCGVLYFVSTVVATGLIASTGTTEQQMEQAAVETFLPSIAANPGMAAVSMLGYVVSMVLLIGFAVALHRLLRMKVAVGLAAPLAVGLGGGLFVVESLLTVGVILELAPAYVTAAGAEQATIGTTAAALLVFRSYSALVAGVLVATGAMLFGHQIRRTDAIPTWLGSIAILLGVLGLVGAFWPLLPALSYLRQAAYFLFSAWALGVGVVLLRR